MNPDISWSRSTVVMTGTDGLPYQVDSDAYEAMVALVEKFNTESPSIPVEEAPAFMKNRDKVLQQEWEKWRDVVAQRNKDQADASSKIATLAVEHNKSMSEMVASQKAADMETLTRSFGDSPEVVDMIARRLGLA